jgi:predicted NUDIX family phosphoesterase
MRVLCVSAAEAGALFSGDDMIVTGDDVVLSRMTPVWVERKLAEEDPSYKQVIPYAVCVREDGSVCCYRRKGSERRLHGRWSCGVGGHVDHDDIAENARDAVYAGLRRELSEEFVGFDESSVAVHFHGFIREERTAVGRVHLGAVFSVVCRNGYLPAAGEELTDMCWKLPGSFVNGEFEEWSILALSLISKAGHDA